MQIQLVQVQKYLSNANLLESLRFFTGIHLHFLWLGTYAFAQLLDLTTPSPRLVCIQLVQV